MAERIEDRLEAGGDPRLEVTELRCSRCRKTRRVVKGEPLPVGQDESRYGWMRRR